MSRLLNYGGPGGVQYLLEAGGFTAFVFLVGRLGQTELAATNLAFNISSFAEVVKLVYTQVSEACGASCEGSSPSFRIFLIININ